MLLNILLFGGILVLLLGGMGWLRLVIPQLRKAILDIFIHNTDDAANEQDTDRAERESRQIYMWLVVIGSVLLIIGLCIKFAPRGIVIIQTGDNVGTSTGNDSIENQQNQQNSDLQYITIRIREKTIFFGENKIGGVEEFEEYLKEIDRECFISLEDDYAVSSTYHKVVDLLDAYGHEIINRK